MLPTVGWTVFSHGGGRLQAMDVTVPEVVEQTPVQTRDGTLFLGSKRDSMLGVDVQSGAMYGEFDFHDGGGGRIPPLASVTAGNETRSHNPSGGGGSSSSDVAWFVRLDYTVRGLDWRTRTEKWNLTRSDLRPFGKNRGSGSDGGMFDGETLVASADGMLTLQCDHPPLHAAAAATRTVTEAVVTTTTMTLMLQR